MRFSSKHADLATNSEIILVTLFLPSGRSHIMSATGEGGGVSQFLIYSDKGGGGGGLANFCFCICLLSSNLARALKFLSFMEEGKI